MNARLIWTIGAFALTFASAPSFAAKDKANKLPDLVKICKKECPDAKNSNEAHECAEDHAKDTKTGEEFKKSKCWLENEKYEVMVKG